MSIDELLKQTTPRPWRAVNGMDRWRVENAEFYICAMADNGRSGELDAELICLAVNAFCTQKESQTFEDKCHTFPLEQPLHDVPMDRQIVMLNRQVEALEKADEQLSALKTERHQLAALHASAAKERDALQAKVQELERSLETALLECNRSKALHGITEAQRSMTIKERDELKARVQALEKALQEIQEVARQPSGFARTCGRIANAAMAGGKEAV